MAPNEAHKRQGSDSAPSVLYIDDDAILCRLVERDLKRHGYQVTLCHDGAAGVAAVRDGAFDVIVLDHYMPGQDGLATLEALRPLPDAPPVIYVTGTDETRVAVAALKQGAVDYVMKDVEGGFVVLLRSSIEQALEQVRLRREKEAAEAEVRAARDRYLALSERQAVMLHEVNHRVANSLQLISALITMQVGRISDPDARQALETARERVHAVAQIHKRLYTSDDVHMVDVDQYLGSLLEELHVNMQDGHRIRLETEIEPMRVATDRAVSIGVIVTELVINAYKYAYPADRTGAIRVMLRRIGERFRLTVEDDGVGFPQAPAQAEGTGIGTRIVTLMARTLDTAVERDCDYAGTRWTLSFA